MNQKSGILSLCANQIFNDNEFSWFDYKDSFDLRLVLQKCVYLMECFGVDLGYRYNWYIRGPYCPDLTEDAFEIINNQDALAEYCKNWSLTDKSKLVINKMKQWIEENKPEQLEQKDWLELLASLHYINHNKYLQNKNKDSVINHLLEVKDWYDRNTVIYAYGVLEEVGLIENSTLS